MQLSAKDLTPSVWVVDDDRSVAAAVARLLASAAVSARGLHSAEELLEQLRQLGVVDRRELGSTRLLDTHPDSTYRSNFKPFETSKRLPQA